ncbi:hypothetical protein [Glycomyces buryatensis]|uniref:Uncharacterized protein n=1 Tax=Glycomyces buryatensis TaxID=2570927 RepID=A0A4S8QJ66_9ACTN|nr:hypothetical protein [Glycomyces buryatensis]THV41409.1 hypothetical protein FAB82_11450 [Glycomyces buryatensis]
MNRALRIIFSRYGIVVIILVLVLGAIALASDNGRTPLTGNDVETDDSTESSEPSDEITDDDGFYTEDCEADDCYAAEELPQEAVDRAVEFAEAWLNPNGLDPDAWYDSIAPFLTTDRAELMVGVDPATLPAQSIDGDATTEASKVSIPMNTGTLILTMAEGSNSWTGGDWLVSAIDWEAS